MTPDSRHSDSSKTLDYFVPPALTGQWAWSNPPRLIAVWHWCVIVLAFGSLASLLFLAYDRRERVLRDLPQVLAAAVVIGSFLSVGLIPAALLIWRGLRSKRPPLVRSAAWIQIGGAAFFAFGAVTNLGEALVYGGALSAREWLAFAVVIVVALALIWIALIQLEWIRSMRT